MYFVSPKRRRPCKIPVRVSFVFSPLDFNTLLARVRFVFNRRSRNGRKVVGYILVSIQYLYIYIRFIIYFVFFSISSVAFKLGSGRIPVSFRNQKATPPNPSAPRRDAETRHLQQLSLRSRYPLARVFSFPSPLCLFRFFSIFIYFAKTLLAVVIIQSVRRQYRYPSLSRGGA